jgi:hypothetical protein
MTKGNTNPNKQPCANSTNLPPKLPGTSEALQRAILLLGNRTKSELGDKSRAELQNLIGAYPTSEQAALWKQTLKQLVRGKLDDLQNLPLQILERIAEQLSILRICQKNKR